MFTHSEIGNVVADLLVKFPGIAETNDDRHYVKLGVAEKVIEIEWPFELAGVWITFHEHGKTIYTDWIECIEQKDKGEFVSYILDIPAKFFLHKCRLERKRIFFYFE